ncbi:hypothetical protein GR702_19160 [Novosphingobium sp. FGD1]|uniref:Major facilitator superfamily (MFS) profile domain-containing protein n=1 Tax=Novosphingobium silvae TaxID=2692619 RepID=A0A7X4GJQ5_9SPHN|nr:hypothetical protein [Novosphingobium silvae]MYL99882.1 hypothetical protein [Novosphingobium silvae]
MDEATRFAGLPLCAAALLLAAALLGGINETGVAGVAPLLSIAGDGSQPLFAAAAVGLGSFAAQYGLGAAADRLGGCKVLMACAALLAAALSAIAIAPTTLPVASFIIGGAGGGIYRRHLKLCSPDNDFSDISGTWATLHASTAPLAR